MTAIDLILQQHREAESLFQQIPAAAEAERVRLIGKVAEALTLHALLEERFVYPVARQLGLEELMNESEEEHAQVKRQVAELIRMKQRDPLLLEAVERLQRDVMTHVQLEEREVLPRLRERGAERMVDTQAMLQSADELQSQGLLQLAARDER